MLRRLLTVVVLFASMSCPAAEPTAEQISKWIEDLDSPMFRVREAAQANLSKVGTAAVAPLAKVARHGSAEASDRAMRILGTLADGPDAKADAAARRELRKIADLDSPRAGEARAILARRRERVLNQLTELGVGYYTDNRGRITDIDLDGIEKSEVMDKAIPLLAELPEIDYISAETKALQGKHLAHFSKLSNLQSINLFTSNIDDEGLKHLVGLKYLRRLPMGRTNLTDKGIETLSKMEGLEYIGLRGNKITDAGLPPLKKLKELRGLYLGETQVTDDGMKTIGELTGLNQLYLHDTTITDTGLQRLHGLKSLRTLYLRNTQTTEAGRDKLLEAIPGLIISEMAR